MTKKIIYTRQMFQYLSWRLFQEMYGAMKLVKEEKGVIDEIVEEAKNKLTDEEIKIVENRVFQMSNEYKSWALDSFKEEYCHESDDDEYDYGEDDFIRPVIEYNREFYEIWKRGVAKLQTVKIKYDSTASGVSERLVDPYKSSAPYGEGYCHSRKEVRKFRFDRVIDIELTDEKFKKPKNWQKSNDFNIDEIIKKTGLNI